MSTAPTPPTDAPQSTPEKSPDFWIEEHKGNSPSESAYDYLIVGSGAGGGPLAARLALAGKKVLVIEAGEDPATTKSRAYPDADPGEVTKLPGYYAAASEDAEMSWMFSVRHHQDDKTQADDKKYNQRIDPNTGGPIAEKYRDPHPGGGKGGIFYPRSAGIGGCTGHHAMITIAPNDKDWNDIAELTGDESWRAGNMRSYFAKFERCQYLDAYQRFFGSFSSILGFFYRLWRSIVLLVDPRAVLDEGGHGRKGWAPTNLIDPFLIFKIKRTDSRFFRVIVKAALATLHGNWTVIAWLKRQLVQARVVSAIDFNDVNTRRANPEGVFLIPLGTESGLATAEDGLPATGRRFGVREFLLNTKNRHPDRLTILTGAHVTRVLFEPGKEAPRAIGIECAMGAHLYEASPLQAQASEKRRCFFVKKGSGEVVLAGGAFNTPQLLMLSGIGPAEHLREKGVTHLSGAKTDGSATKSEMKLVDLPGVGGNLQDRYEVTVVSELDREFATLEGVAFEPGKAGDPARKEWLKNRSGLYATNGGTLAVIRRSKPVVQAGGVEPDLFTFGAPAAFRGYYWNWSREIFRATMGAPTETRKLWSWVILKAYTHNKHGSVRLRTGSPFDMPEICFDVFNEQAEKRSRELERELEKISAESEDLKRQQLPEPVDLARRREALEAEHAALAPDLARSRADLAALVDAVAFMRKVNAENPGQFVYEIQPSTKISDHSADMEKWIKTQAWGHHASCTCPIGPYAWQPDPAEVKDGKSVLDSRFRVHGVEGLRVVDASVFPRIPGYFILAAIFMVSEKAADTLLEDATTDVYPAGFEASEAAAIRARRVRVGIAPGRERQHADEQQKADLARVEQKKKAPRNQEKAEPRARAAQQSAPATVADNDSLPDDVERKLPRDTVGLAFSGGGIRSATFALGVLQALAAHRRLRDVDLLSTVSGGGFIGTFLGRLFTRPGITRAANPAGRVEEILTQPRSGPLWWLRTQANYIFANGASDYWLNLAVFWRNIFTIYLVFGTLFFATFGLLAWLPGGVGQAFDWLGWFRLRALLEPLFTPPTLGGIRLSPWWWLPVLAFGLGVLPGTLGYWLAPKAGSYRQYPVFPLLAWLVLLAGAVAAFAIPHGLQYAAAVLAVLILAWVWQEVARWGALTGRESATPEQHLGRIVRNRLSRALAEAGWLFLALLAWVVIDTLALLFATSDIAEAVAAIMAALGPAYPWLRNLAMSAKQENSKGKKRSLRQTATLLGLPLAIGLLWLLDILAHNLRVDYPGALLPVVALLFVFSAAIGRAFDFLNLSSLLGTYTVRLARTFLGASNEDRIYSTSDNESRDVQLAHPNDDLPFDQYHPEHHGGPLHLINVCVNETVDLASDREVRERKGLSMCVTPHGVSVGRRYFAEWMEPDALPRWQKRRRRLDGLDADDDLPVPKRRRTALRALPASTDPNAFHVLKTINSESAECEPLTVGTWTAISGAAFTTGIGRGTKLPLSLLMGLANVRLGYWWDSGILSFERPGRYPLSLWRKIKRIPVTLFRMQSLLISEFWGRFHGGSRWFWYLSDGGHFEVTAIYELLRRRVPLIIASDAGEDKDYRWGDVALLTQQARLDFSAEIEWLKPDTDASGTRAAGWSAFPDDVPELLKDWFDPEAIGAKDDIAQECKRHAALARVSYLGSEARSWIVLLKPSFDETLPADVTNYAAENDSFPQQPTFDQVFDDLQWESYRVLGARLTGAVLKKKGTPARCP